MTDAHLDDETLSATLDGGAWPEHLAGCQVCMDSRRRLESVAHLVSGYVPPAPPEAREAAVAAALAAVPGPRARVPLGRLTAVAATVVLILGLAMASVMSQGGPRPTVEDAAPAPEGSGSFVTDLGVVPDEASLNARLRQVLGAGAASDSAEPPPDALSATESAPVDQSGEREASSLEACTTAARSYTDEGAPVAYSARLAWKGRPAYVMVFVLTAREPISRQAVVVSDPDCELLVSQSF